MDEKHKIIATYFRAVGSHNVASAFEEVMQLNNKGIAFAQLSQMVEAEIENSDELQSYVKGMMCGVLLSAALDTEYDREIFLLAINQAANDKEKKDVRNDLH